jgi:hypothetical protein
VCDSSKTPKWKIVHPEDSRVLHRCFSKNCETQQQELVAGKLTVGGKSTKSDASSSFLLLFCREGHRSCQKKFSWSAGACDKALGTIDSFMNDVSV